MQHRLGVALLVTQMAGQLGLQTSFKACLDQLLDQSARTLKLDLTSIDLGEQVIQNTRLGKPVSTLSLLSSTFLASIFVDHGHQCRPFVESRHPLHKPSDTP